MAIYHLKHASVGRSTHAAGTAGAHVSYITRTGACREVLGSDMPVPAAGERGGEARTWLNAQEEADRKNARVIDKVTIALPLELDAMQRVELVRAFAAEVTQGRVPWLAAIHDQDRDADNPHAHLVLRDRDLETGKMALRMSQSGSTEMLRETWERVCNAALERAGVNERIDRRTLEAQGIEREPTKHIGPQALQIEAREPQGSWKIAALAKERLNARPPVVGRPAGLFARAEAFVRGTFGRGKERETEKSGDEPQAASERRTTEGLMQIRTLAGRALDMLDLVRALPNRQDRPRGRALGAVEAPEPLSVTQTILRDAQRAREDRARDYEAEEAEEAAQMAYEAKMGIVRPQIDPFASYRESSPDHYRLARTSDDHQEVIRLLRDNTTTEELDRFRNGDLSAISHITTDPVFSRQLLTTQTYEDRADGRRIPFDLENVLREHREVLQEHFKADFERDREAENER